MTGYKIGFGMTGAKLSVQDKRVIEITPIRDSKTFLTLGSVLIVSGGLAILAPEISTRAAGLILGGALAVAGLTTIINSILAKGFSGFSWHLFSGVMELVGGVVVYLNPRKGTVGLTVLLALIFLSLGITHIGLAMKMRPQQGWGWFLASGLVALCASAVLLLKMVYTFNLEPGLMLGISLVFSGFAYLATAFMKRNTEYDY